MVHKTYKEGKKKKGGAIQTPSGRWGVWLDSPLIEIIQGSGYLSKNFPAMVRQFIRYQIDITKEPMLVYPSLHYQNGGVEINAKCETNIPGLYVAGEASGGVHGRNRLMGNSVLDYNVFGRRAGKYAAEYTKHAALGKLTLEHITAYENEFKKARIKTDRMAPVLLPSYTPKDVRKRQLTAHYEGTLR
jgi:succinate dehydrogenase/fumarate reductase flavoprotein subunit